MERSDQKMDYPRALSEHLLDRQYRPETVAYIGRACRVGRISEQTALELIEAVEADRTATDAEMMVSTAWDIDMLQARGDTHGG